MVVLVLLVACGSPGGGLRVDTDAPPFDGMSARLDDTHGTLVWVTWVQNVPATTWVEYRIGDGAWQGTPPRERDAGPAEQVLLGIPYGETVIFRVVNDLGDGPWFHGEGTQTTADLPAGVPVSTRVTGDPEAWDAATRFLFLSLADTEEAHDTWDLFVDRDGRVVWAQESPTGTVSLQPRVAANGRDLLVDANSFWGFFDGGATSAVTRMKIDGSVLAVYDTPGLHHPYVDLPDGRLVWASMQNTSETLEVLSVDGEAQPLWNCQTLLASLGVEDTCGSNTLWWDEATGHLYDSLYTLDTIVDLDVGDLDGSAGAPVRWFGNLPGAWAFEPAESQFWWQHGGYLTPDGTLLTSTKNHEDGDETVVREYRLDDARDTLVEVWSYGEGQGIYGNVMGEPHRLANGNTLENFGAATRIQEVTPDGTVVWDIDWDCDLLGRSTPVADLYAFAP